MPAPLLAAPLVIPFAEAIGVSIAALGMAKATDKVNEFIQENPEDSIKIFQMIMPSQGIANALKNKSSEGDEEVSEDMDVEVKEKPKLTGKEKSEKIKAAIRRARAGKGNYSSPDAEGSAVDIRGSVIREVEDMGLADKDLKDKPYKEKGYDFRDYIPRGAYKKRYADGGAIGIEVLFEEKKPRKNFNTGGTPYDARATTQDYANALQKVSAGTTYQQQAQAKDYARQEASNLLSQAMRSGNQANIQSILQGVGGITSIPGMQFNRSGNRITSIPATGPGRDKILNAMANQMLNTTSYGGGSSAPPQKSPLQLKIEENKRLYDEYVKNNPPAIGLISGSQGGAPTIPKPEYEDQALLSQLTMLTPEEAFAGETFDTLSDLDQYNFAQAFSQFQPQLRDSSYVSPYGAPSGRDIFSRRYGIKDGGRVGLFMGGPPLEGQALQTYNSMKAYGFSDQEIADALSLQRASASSAEPATATAPINIYNQIGGGGEKVDDDDDDSNTNNAGLKGFDAVRTAGLFALNPVGYLASKALTGLYNNYKNPYTNITGGLNKDTRDAIDAQGRDSAPGRGDAGNPGGSSGSMDDSNAGSFCFDPNTLIQMANGSNKKIKDIQLGDDTKGGEVTGVFQFKASDEIYDYKGVTVAGSHFVKEDDKFIMVKDSPLSVKIDKIPVVYSLDTTGRRIFIKDIEFADYNGDGIAKGFLSNAGVDLTGFDTEVLRQVENRLI